jgi:AcrR family transcriptional regulator
LFIKTRKPGKEQMNNTHSKSDQRAKILNDALSLAAEIGWRHLSLRDLALKSGLSLAQLYGQFTDKNALLLAYEQSLMHRVLETAARHAPDSMPPPREILFDMLMERFELMNEHRAALLVILGDLRLDPKAAVIGMPHLAGSMNWMLEAAGIDTGGVRGAIKIAGLSAVYLKAVHAWRRDESPDLGSTMAALDRALGHAERAAGTFGV